jgi:hypothetical protein
MPCFSANFSAFPFVGDMTAIICASATFYKASTRMEEINCEPKIPIPTVSFMNSFIY